MGLFDHFKKQKSDLELYYEDRERIDQGFEPDVNLNRDFRLIVDDVFTVTGRGTIVVGVVEFGRVSTGDTVRLFRPDGSVRYVEIGSVEMFRKMVHTARKGDAVGLLLKGVLSYEVSAGDILTK